VNEVIKANEARDHGILPNGMMASEIAFGLPLSTFYFPPSAFRLLPSAYCLLPSGQGRWMTPDPLGGEISNPQSLNRYSYALDNPTTLTDPLGLDTQPCMIDGQEGLCTTTTAAGSSDDYLLWPVWQYNFCAAFPFACGAPQPAFGFGGGGGGSAPPPKPTPAPLRPTIPQRLACAANFGDTHSVAGVLGIQNNLVGNLFLGNPFSGAVELGQTVFGSASLTVGQIATTLLGGSGQGLIPATGEHPGLGGAAGIAQDAIVKGAIGAGYNLVRGVGTEPIELGLGAAGKIATPVIQLSSETLGTIAAGVGVVKFVYDASTFGLGLYRGCQQ